MTFPRSNQKVLDHYHNFHSSSWRNVPSTTYFLRLLSSLHEADDACKKGLATLLCCVRALKIIFSICKSETRFVVARMIDFPLVSF